MIFTASSCQCGGDGAPVSAELAELGRVMRKYPTSDRESLIAILQDTQDTLGYLSSSSILEIARYLSMRASKVYGVATFYNQFRLEPAGEHTIRLCRGTACHVRGSKQLQDVLEVELGVPAGRTTRDGRFMLETVACLGCCGLAPVMMIDETAFGRLTSKAIPKILSSVESSVPVPAGRSE